MHKGIQGGLAFQKLSGGIAGSGVKGIDSGERGRKQEDDEGRGAFERASGILCGQRIQADEGSISWEKSFICGPRQGGPFFIVQMTENGDGQCFLLQAHAAEKTRGHGREDHFFLCLKTSGFRTEGVS